MNVKQIEKAYAITDARISFVSLVDKAANKRQFLITKAKDGAVNFESGGRILKADEANHYVTGVVYEPLVEDCHGNYMTEEEITKAAYWYAKNGDKVDIQHSFNALENATVVENWISKADFEVGGEKVSKGTWLMTIEVTDPDVWKGIQKGEITGLSMGGIGNYSEEDIDVDTITKASDSKGLFKRLGEALGMSVVEKGVIDTYNKSTRRNNFWQAFDALTKTLIYTDYYDNSTTYESDERKIREALQEFNDIIVELLNGSTPIVKALQPAQDSIEKAGKKMSCRNKEALDGIYASLGEFIKGFEAPDIPDDEEKPDGENADKNTPAPEEGEKKSNKDTKEDKTVTKAEVEQIVASAIEKALGSKAEQNGAGAPTTSESNVEKSAEGKDTTVEKASEITAESIAAMVAAAVEKADKTEAPKALTVDDVQGMIEKAVGTALKARNTPRNLNGAGSTAPAAQHFMHGIL